MLHAGPELTHVQLERSLASREPINYPHKRNYQGFYWFAQLEHLVWYESLVECAALRMLDHFCTIRGISAQPFCIVFPNNLRHYPDYFAVHASGEQVVYDVRPAALLDPKTIQTFVMTESVCQAVGWRYEVLTGAPNRSASQNLEWIAGYRFDRFAPPSAVVESVRAICADPVSIGRAASALGFPTAYAALFHLMWKRALFFDLMAPLGDDTLIIWDGEP